MPVDCFPGNVEPRAVRQARELILDCLPGEPGVCLRVVAKVWRKSTAGWMLGDYSRHDLVHLHPDCQIPTHLTSATAGDAERPDRVRLLRDSEADGNAVQ